jgi:hypothetical protein
MNGGRDSRFAAPFDDCGFVIAELYGIVSLTAHVGRSETYAKSDQKVK